MKKIEVWVWSKGGPVPEVEEGGLVVCEPGLADGSGTEAQIAAARLVEAYLRERPSVRLVMSSADPQEAFERFGDVLIAPRTVPALHVTRQADLARLPALREVKAERWALVVTPGEAIDLVAGGALGCDCPDDERCWGICAFYRSWPLGVAKRRIDAVFIVGGDAPVHPDWVRSIVEQCRAVHVPVVFLGWGAYLPESHSTNIVSIAKRVTLHTEQAPGILWWCVGDECSGALLDGAQVEDVPAWVGGGA